MVGHQCRDVRLVIDHENALSHDGLFCGIIVRLPVECRRGE
jgi:hypothetical protein